MGILDGTTPLAQLRYRDDTLPTDTSIAQVRKKSPIAIRLSIDTFVFVEKDRGVSIGMLRDLRTPQCST